MRSTRELQKLLGQRIETVITSSENPRSAMDEIAEEATRRGLIISPNDLRRDSPLAFVKDLWLDNPVILDRVNLHRETMREPLQVSELHHVLDLLR